MSPQVLARVFEPFFTTKEIGKGSGLGLSMVYGFAQQSGGHVDIASTEGQGTTITIVLPAVAKEAGSSQINDAVHSTLMPGTERVLLVEDNPEVLKFVASQLRSFGYHVTPSSTGAEALKLLEQGQNYDLLFTDVVLPHGMSGIELANKVRSLNPKLRVLLTSGYSEDVFQQHGRPADDTPLLRKPYKRADLAKALRSVLEAA
jgi:CheY-like chemotaxis protein